MRSKIFSKAMKKVIKEIFKDNELTVKDIFKSWLWEVVKFESEQHFS